MSATDLALYFVVLAGRLQIAQWRYHNMPGVPQQSNGVDCGAFMLAMADR
jgi:Ulp1 protease family, C-terminal catalytic domain